MKLVPFIIWAGFCLIFTLGPVFVDSVKVATTNTKTATTKTTTTANKNYNKRLSSSVPTFPSLIKTQFKSSNTSLLLEGSNSSPRVKRGGGHGRSYSTSLAYSRINDSGQRERGRGGGHGGGHGEGRRRNAIGEDGTHIGDFKSHGVGYEHQHGGQCEESKCGYNIRHCPHGCVFNSFTCGGGAAYDTCCC